MAAAQPTSRRDALKSCGSGFGYLSFAALAHAGAAEAQASDSYDNGLSPQPTHFTPRARRVIFLCMNGGPSHVDLYDYKPALDQRSTSATKNSRLLPSPFRFNRHGESGLRLSEVMPHLSSHVDDLCMIHSMHTDLPNHSQAFVQMHTGSFQFVRPSLGAWTLYGLGADNQNLPGFVTVNPPSDNGGAKNYGSAFLPAVCQGTRVGRNQLPAFYAALLKRNEEPGPPLKNVSNDFLSRKEQRRQLDLIRSLNARKLSRDVYNPEIEGAIESFELAYRMQDEIPDVLDITSESQSTFDLYGVGSGKPTDGFGRQCILARRLIESGVRFVEITSAAKWDHHFLLKDELIKSCSATDQPVAALLTDLKQRGLLEDTLVVWAGEFGRTPYGQSGSGRDHNNKGYTIWMSGGGVRGGLSYGSTDDIGAKAVENLVHIHDWHATMLHLLGLDHERLTFNYAGRNFRLTDVHGRVVRDILA